MLTQAAVMQHHGMKAGDANAEESLYRLLLERQQQQQRQDSSSFRLGMGHGGLNLPGSLPPLNAPSLRLGSIALPNYPSMVPSSLALSRQQLLQSLLAAEEREIYQRRLALEDQLVCQQRQGLSFAPPQPPSRESFMTSLAPISQAFLSSTNVPVESQGLSGRKRSFDETATYKSEDQGHVSEARKAPPVAMPCERTQVTSTTNGPQASPKAAPQSDRKPAPKKKKNPKKNPKTSDSSVASEPKKDTKWLNMLEELKVYKAKYGNCIVPRGYSPNPRLASWVAEQRKQYKLMTDGKPTSITQERINKLKELDFAWNAQEAAWARHMNDLKAFKEEHGHCHVPLSHTRFPKLGLWVKEQRRHYTLMQQNKPSHMTATRAAELNAVGFCWDTHEATWLERLRQLNDYKNRHGDCLVPTGWGVNPKLGTWVNHQRRQYKKFHEGKPSHITQERIDQLEEIGFCWDTRGEASDMSTATDCSDSESESGSLPPRKRHRLIM